MARLPSIASYSYVAFPIAFIYPRALLTHCRSLGKLALAIEACSIVAAGSDVVVLGTSRVARPRRLLLRGRPR
jgi:hypothetical protein